MRLQWKVFFFDFDENDYDAQCLLNEWRNEERTQEGTILIMNHYYFERIISSSFGSNINEKF